MSLKTLSNSNNPRRKVQVQVTIEVASEEQLSQVHELFRDYFFIADGLVKVGNKLRKGDFITVAATKEFIKKA